MSLFGKISSKAFSLGSTFISSKSAKKAVANTASSGVSKTVKSISKVSDAFTNKGVVKTTGAFGSQAKTAVSGGLSKPIQKATSAAQGLGGQLKIGRKVAKYGGLGLLGTAATAGTIYSGGKLVGGGIDAVRNSINKTSSQIQAEQKVDLIRDLTELPALFGDTPNRNDLGGGAGGVPTAGQLYNDIFRPSTIPQSDTGGTIEGSGLFSLAIAGALVAGGVYYATKKKKSTKSSSKKKKSKGKY